MKSRYHPSQYLVQSSFSPGILLIFCCNRRVKILIHIVSIYLFSQEQKQHQSNEKPRVHVKSLMNLLQQPDYGHGEQIRSPRANENTSTVKMSNLMTMPTFDLTTPPATSANHQPKLKVKPGLHLLDPLAMQRRFLANASSSGSGSGSGGGGGGNSSCEDSPEVGSTTNGIEEIMMNNPTMIKWVHTIFYLLLLPMCSDSQ